MREEEEEEAVEVALPPTDNSTAARNRLMTTPPLSLFHRTPLSFFLLFCFFALFHPPPLARH